MQALRFLTAGSVDDGKSTLIGRLLFDSQAILADQLDVLERRAAGNPVDLSLLTDGLEAEREQGITIDVAYRYFATKTRKFIIADAPGHEQYTRNMVTAAAGSDAAVVLVDITKLDTSAASVALLPQTRRPKSTKSALSVDSASSSTAGGSPSLCSLMRGARVASVAPAQSRSSSPHRTCSAQSPAVGFQPIASTSSP